MKLITRSLAIISLVFTASTGLRAQDWPHNFYYSFDAGGIWQQDATLRQTTSSSKSATFNLGVRGDLIAGYNFNEAWAAEIELGFIWSSIDKVGGTELSSIHQSVDIYSVPVLANLIYKLPPIRGWTPYVGVGAGASVNTLDFGNSGTSHSDSCLTPAIQAQAGVKYAFSKHASVGVAYKFLGTLNQRYNLNAIGDRITIDGEFLHGIFANLTWTY
jgi:opacity protein-like surface antigen